MQDTIKTHHLMPTILVKNLDLNMLNEDLIGWICLVLILIEEEKEDRKKDSLRLKKLKRKEKDNLQVVKDLINQKILLWLVYNKKWEA